MTAALVLAAASFSTAAIGALGGIGGAVLLVPLLVATGMPASQAAPLGLVSVAAASVAAGPLQLRQKATNHRLGVTTEVAATLGATMGALGSGLVSEGVLGRGLAVVAGLAGLAMLRRRGATVPDEQDQTPGEWPGQIAGVTPVADGTVTYRARHLPLGLAAMWVSGIVAGIGGVGGGFIKTPVTVNIMGIPTKAAAATTTFTIGVTAAAGLIVFAVQGRVDAEAAAAVIAGGLLGGQGGARLQGRVPTRVIRIGLGVILSVVGVLLWVRSA